MPPKAGILSVKTAFCKASLASILIQAIELFPATAEVMLAPQKTFSYKKKNLKEALMAHSKHRKNFLFLSI